MSNKSEKSATSSVSSVPAMELMDINDDNVRTTRGDILMESDAVAPQSPPPPSGSMLGYMARGIQGFLSATPSEQDKASADALMASQAAMDQLLPSSREVEATVHEDTPFQSRAPSLSPDRQDRQARSSSSSSSIRRTEKDAEEQFGGIPIPEEGDGYGMTDDDEDSDELDLTLMRMTPEDLIDALQRGRRVRGRDGLLDPDVVIPGMRKLIADRKERLRKQNSPEVRSVLECQRTGTILIVLHPRGSWIRYRLGKVFLASVGHQPLPGMEISRAMMRHLYGTKVITLLMICCQLHSSTAGPGLC